MAAQRKTHKSACAGELHVVVNRAVATHRIVTRNDAHLFVAGSRSFPALGEFGRIETITYIGDGAFKWQLAPTPPDTMRTFLWRAHIASWIDQPMRIGDIEIREYADSRRGSLQQGRVPDHIIYEVASRQNVAESDS
jgi:hypothetical protein